ncbi:MAG: ACT domain-containing protein [Desulfofustis sp.]|nr:ACT domain-containing protein [Desulfofustis sp.]
MMLTLTTLKGSYSIHRFAPDATVPDTIQESRFYSVSRTDEELSIVCEATIDLYALQSETDWRILKIVGPLDFSLTGVLAAVSELLAGREISIFALSTFDTDYILVRESKLAEAKRVMTDAGHRII